MNTPCARMRRASGGSPTAAHESPHDAHAVIRLQLVDALSEHGGPEILAQHLDRGHRVGDQASPRRESGHDTAGGCAVSPFTRTLERTALRYACRRRSRWRPAWRVPPVRGPPLASPACRARRCAMRTRWAVRIVACSRRTSSATSCALRYSRRTLMCVCSVRRHKRRRRGGATPLTRSSPSPSRHRLHLPRPLPARFRPLRPSQPPRPHPRRPSPRSGPGAETAASPRLRPPSWRRQRTRAASEGCRRGRRAARRAIRGRAQIQRPIRPTRPAVRGSLRAIGQRLGPVVRGRGAEGRDALRGRTD